MRSVVLALLMLGLGPALAGENNAGRGPVLPTLDYANTRYSGLDQITTANVGQLKVAWTYSTGALRGHEGAPLVIGHVMIVHTPFPNTVTALDLDQDGRILWRYAPRQEAGVVAVMCCDTVHRGPAYQDGRIFLQLADTTVVALDVETGRVLWSVRNGDPARGETNTAAVMPVGDKLIVGLSGGEYGARCHLTAYDQATGRRLWRAYATGPDHEMLVDPEKIHGARQAGRREFLAEELGGRAVEDRRGLRLGLVLLRSGAEPDLLRHRQSLDLEPGAAPGRQPLGDGDRRPRRRDRRGALGLPDDAPRPVGL